MTNEEKAELQDFIRSTIVEQTTHMKHALLEVLKDQNTRFAHLEARFTHLEARFTHLEARFDTLETRFGIVLDALRGLQVEVADLRSRFDRFSGDVIQGRTKDSDRVSRLEKKLEELSDRVSTLETPQ